MILTTFRNKSCELCCVSYSQALSPQRVLRAHNLIQYYYEFTYSKQRKKNPGQKATTADMPSGSLSPACQPYHHPFELAAAARCPHDPDSFPKKDTSPIRSGSRPGSSPAATALDEVSSALRRRQPRWTRSSTRYAALSLSVPRVPVCGTSTLHPELN
jgi:hypothetical protein